MWSAAWGLGLGERGHMEKTVLLYLGSSLLPRHAPLHRPIRWGLKTHFLREACLLGTHTLCSPTAPLLCLLSTGSC